MSSSMCCGPAMEFYRKSAIAESLRLGTCGFLEEAKPLEWVSELSLVKEMKKRMVSVRVKELAMMRVVEGVSVKVKAAGFGLRFASKLLLRLKPKSLSSLLSANACVRFFHFSSPCSCVCQRMLKPCKV